MEHFFNLPVVFRGNELSLPARLATFAYSFKFYVMVAHTELVFEKDDEGQYRMLGEHGNLEIDRELVVAIVSALERIQE